MMDEEKDHIQKQGEIVTDLLMRVAGMERLLISKNIITESELTNKISEVRDEILAMIKDSLSKKDKV